MAVPQFFVIARVVGSDGAFKKWQERLVPLCEVSKTEPHSTSYYWGQDVDGEPDTLWGLEGYSHAVGFFLGHPASDIFKREMQKVDEEKLLRHVQGLGSPDYDLHYYDFDSGFLTRRDDRDKDCKDSFVVILHYWANVEKRRALLASLARFADNVQNSEQGPSISVQSCAALKECRDINLATLYLRLRTRSHWQQFAESSLMKDLDRELAPTVSKQEQHRSQAFNGHIDQAPPIGYP